MYRGRSAMEARIMASATACASATVYLTTCTVCVRTFRTLYSRPSLSPYASMHADSARMPRCLATLSSEPRL